MGHGGNQTGATGTDTLVSAGPAKASWSFSETNVLRNAHMWRCPHSLPAFSLYARSWPIGTWDRFAVQKSYVVWILNSRSHIPWRLSRSEKATLSRLGYRVQDQGIIGDLPISAEFQNATTVNIPSQPSTRTAEPWSNRPAGTDARRPQHYPAAFDRAEMEEKTRYPKAATPLCSVQATKIIDTGECELFTAEFNRFSDNAQKDGLLGC